MAYYLDSSAFLKLLVREPESTAMRAWFADRVCWSSQLLVTESMRAGVRLALPPATVETALERVSLVLPAANTFHLAGSLSPLGLRSLDALHLATALELGDDLDGIVSYDARLLEGAHEAGLTVLSPS